MKTRSILLVKSKKDWFKFPGKEILRLWKLSCRWWWITIGTRNTQSSTPALMRLRLDVIHSENISFWGVLVRLSDNCLTLTDSMPALGCIDLAGIFICPAVIYRKISGIFWCIEFLSMGLGCYTICNQYDMARTASGCASLSRKQAGFF